VPGLVLGAMMRRSGDILRAKRPPHPDRGIASIMDAALRTGSVAAEFEAALNHARLANDAILGDQEIAKNLPPLTFRAMMQTSYVAIQAARVFRRTPITGLDDIPYPVQLREFRDLVNRSEILKKALRDTPLRDHLRRSFRTIGGQYILNALFSFAFFYMSDAMKFQVIADERNAANAWEKIAKTYPDFAHRALDARERDLGNAVDADDEDWL
jgi:hypothetical protein